MATLTVLKFDTAGGADQMQSVLRDLAERHLITILDAAVVSWPEGDRKPKTRQLANLTAAGALTGAFWGLLFGLLFFVPLLGALTGAAIGALSGALTDVGINDDFIKRVREQLTPGTSALFLLSATAVPDRVADEIRNRDIDFEIIATNLSQEQEQRLKEIFSESEA